MKRIIIVAAVVLVGQFVAGCSEHTSRSQFKGLNHWSQIHQPAPHSGH